MLCYSMLGFSLNRSFLRLAVGESTILILEKRLFGQQYKEEEDEDVKWKEMKEGQPEPCTFCHRTPRKGYRGWKERKGS